AFSAIYINCFFFLNVVGNAQKRATEKKLVTIYEMVFQVADYIANIAYKINDNDITKNLSL
uniref:Helitron_like_N domain-containing protein n=1 Tax=Strongyloides venezuelensis TaxID=75913 RepID=A0A0K0FTD8_STRVS